MWTSSIFVYCGIFVWKKRFLCAKMVFLCGKRFFVWTWIFCVDRGFSWAKKRENLCGKGFFVRKKERQFVWKNCIFVREENLCGKVVFLCIV